MQFDKDLNSTHAKLFLDTKEYLLKQIGDDAKEKYSDNITSFFSSLGGICYLKTTKIGLHIGWFRGANFDDIYGELFGKGKTIRGQIIKKLDKISKKSITYYVKQTKDFLIEHNELMKLKKGVKNAKSTNFKY